MKEYKEPSFESIYFEVDEKVMGDPRTDESGQVITNPFGDDFVSGEGRFNGLSLKA